MADYDTKFKTGEDTYKKAIVDSWLVTIVTKNKLQRVYVFGGGSVFKALGNFLESFSNFYDLTEPYIRDKQIKDKALEFMSDFHKDRDLITLKRIKELFSEYAIACKKYNLIGEEGIMLLQGFDSSESTEKESKKEKEKK